MPNWQPIRVPPGLIRGNSPYETPGRWYDMNLVRWDGAFMRPIGGWQRLSSSALTGAVRKIHPWRSNSFNRQVLVGTDDRLYADQGSYANITPAGFVPLSSIGVSGGYGTFDFGEETYGTARSAPSPVFSPYAYWTFSNWGEDVFVTANSDGRLFYYDVSSPTTAPTVVSGAPTGVCAAIVTEERHVMVFGPNEGPTPRPFRAAWCSRENFNDWNFSSTTNTAGFQDLAARSPILKAVRVAEGILVFTRSEVFLGQYVGLPFVYGFRWIGDTATLHPDSIATFNGKAVWLDRTGLKIYQGGVVQPLECPLMGAVKAEADPLYTQFRVHACHHGGAPEVWFFYPSLGQKECNRYLAWNYATNIFYWGKLTRSAMSPAEVWQYPYMGAPSGHMFQHEDGWTDAGQPRFQDIFVESGMLDMPGDFNQAMVSGGAGYDNVGMTFFGARTMQGNERTFGPYYGRPDGYYDTRVSGLHGRVRFAPRRDGEWSIGTLKVDVSDAPTDGR